MKKAKRSRGELFWIVKKTENGESWFVAPTLAWSRRQAVGLYVADRDWKTTKASWRRSGVKLEVVKVCVEEVS